MAYVIVGVWVLFWSIAAGYGVNATAKEPMKYYVMTHNGY
jgi:hypothetical protein